jgi:protein disulfide-isomerase
MTGKGPADGHPSAGPFRNLDAAAEYVDLGTSGIPALVVLDPSSGRIKVATNQGEFANARTMSADQVETFLKRWA